LFGRTGLIPAPRRANRLTGTVNNSDIGKYIASVLRLGDLDAHTRKYFSPHTRFFPDAAVYMDSLVVTKGNDRIVLYANMNRAKIIRDGKVEFKQLPTIAVRLGKDGETSYYIPKEVARYLN